MRPIISIELRTFVEFILPNERISFRSIVCGFGGSCLSDRNAFASSTRHDGDRTLTFVRRRIGWNDDRDGTRLRYGVFRVERDEITFCIGSPFLTCGIDVYGVRTTIVGCRNAFLRDVNADGCNGFVIAAPTTTPKGYGEREQICIKHKSFHKVLFCFFKDDVANGDVCSNGCTTEVKEE